jgi:Uma2 family endonuclease
MQEYLDNGARLGWLIHLSAQTVEIYQPERSPQSIQLPGQLSDDRILPGFTLSLGRLTHLADAGLDIAA